MNNEITVLECRRAVTSYPLQIIACVLSLFYFVKKAPLVFYFIVQYHDYGFAGLRFHLSWIIPIIMVIWIIALQRTQYIRLTDQRLIGHSGFIRSIRMTTPLEKIGDISVSSDLLGKLFGYATIRITTVSNSVYSFRGMYDAMWFSDQLQNYLYGYANDGQQ